jgi:hypothetical protein
LIRVIHALYEYAKSCSSRKFSSEGAATFLGFAYLGVSSSSSNVYPRVCRVVLEKPRGLLWRSEVTDPPRSGSGQIDGHSKEPR